MNDVKLKMMMAAHSRNSSSNFSVSSVESGGGTSSRFSASVQSEDGDGKDDHWSPPRLVQQTGVLSKDAYMSPLRRVGSGLSGEIEIIKERFSRLLLGEDMSGSGNGVQTALAISNGITNLYASIFGDLGRLEALPIEKKKIWRREMEWLLSVSNHIVEMAPSYKLFPDGTKLEVMTCKQRSDLFVNLPALRKLDSMLIALLDEFREAEFWYVDQVKMHDDTAGPVSFENVLKGQKDKWWLPVPRIPKHGLSVDSKKQLHLKHDCAMQILKAAMIINADTISEMEIPESYLESLPKNGKACLGDRLHKLIASDHFSPERVIGCLDLTAGQHIVSELVNRLEAAITVWHDQASQYSSNKSPSAEAERRELFSARAEELLLTVKQQFPQLPQTTLEVTKIQCNRDVGKSILESYSRVLESLAHNIVARIDDLLSMDARANEPDMVSSPSGTMPPTHHTISSCIFEPVTRSTSGTASPTSYHHSHSKSAIVPINKLPRRHNSLAKRIMANYLCLDPRAKHGQSSKNNSAISSPKADSMRTS